MHRNALFKALTRDCGQLLASHERMSAVGAVAVPVTGIVGVGGPRGTFTPHRGESNDGLVSLAEVTADRITDRVRLPTVHTVLPMSRSVATIILDRLGTKA